MGCQINDLSTTSANSGTIVISLTISQIGFDKEQMSFNARCELDRSRSIH